jgi:hypothetical protein
MKNDYYYIPPDSAHGRKEAYRAACASIEWAADVHSEISIDFRRNQAMKHIEEWWSLCELELYRSREQK